MPPRSAAQRLFEPPIQTEKSDAICLLGREAAWEASWLSLHYTTGCMGAFAVLENAGSFNEGGSLDCALDETASIAAQLRTRGLSSRAGQRKIAERMDHVRKDEFGWWWHSAPDETSAVPIGLS